MVLQKAKGETVFGVLIPNAKTRYAVVLGHVYLGAFLLLSLLFPVNSGPPQPYSEVLRLWREVQTADLG